MPRMTYSIFFLTLCCFSSSTLSDNYFYIPSQSDFGGVGLIQMPNARNAQEGEFYLGASLNKAYHHYFASLQLMPWLATTIRYTQTQNRQYSQNPDFSDDTLHTDKGIDIKFRLFKESYWVPETSIGLRDFSGTGLFSGEFITASKRWNNLDFTLGIAWGYIGNSANLFGDKSTIDCDRIKGFKGKGGSIDFERWFTGCAALFGGMEYQTSWDPLLLKLEYDANDYKTDFANNLTQKSPWNIGLVYRYTNWGNLHLSYERGNTVTLGFSFNTNFNTLSQIWLDEPTPAYKKKQGTKSEDIDWPLVSENLNQIAGYTNSKIYADDEKITLMASQRKYRNAQLAQEKATNILLNTGTKATTFSIIEMEKNQPINQVDINLKQYKKVLDETYIGAKTSDAITARAPSNHLEPVETMQQNNQKIWNASITPSLQQSIGGAEGFYLFNLGLNTNAAFWLTSHLELSGSLYLNLYDNYDKFSHTMPQDLSEIKRVRTLIRQYIQDNPIRLSNLQLTYFNTFSDSFYFQAYGGYLETMFAGLGSELLYRRQNDNWAFGTNINYVKQRDPDSQFALFKQTKRLDLKTSTDYYVQTGVVTGHASIYYYPKWELMNNLRFKLSLGQYLAGDRGATVELSKRFNSGVITGAYATKTNLSAEQYGEGSFTKGFYISIPFDLLTVNPSTSRTLIAWNPLTRDGGQMLNLKYDLYQMTTTK